MRVIIFGNSGSGKTTLSRALCAGSDAAHFDLDGVAWGDASPVPQRRPVEDSLEIVRDFIGGHERWVIEGCYADLLAAIAPLANIAIYLDLSVGQCIENARKRPFEPEKYATRQAQDENLAMLVQWISDYPVRKDELSQSAHEALYSAFGGVKYRCREAEDIEAARMQICRFNINRAGQR